MLDLSLWLLLATAVVFLLLVYILNEKLYKPMLKFMSDREVSISNDLKSANQNSDDVDASLEEANQIISKAKGEAAKIREEALNKAKESSEKGLEAKRDELENEYSGFLKELEVKREELKSGLLGNISDYQDGIKAKLKELS